MIFTTLPHLYRLERNQSANQCQSEIGTLLPLVSGTKRVVISKAEVMAFHLDALVWDNHACMPIRADDSFLPELVRVHKSGVNVVILNVGYGEVTLDTQIGVIPKPK